MKEIYFSIDTKDEELFSNALIINGVESMEILDTDIKSKLNDDEKNWDYNDIPQVSSDTICFKIYVEDEEVNSLLENVRHDYDNYRIINISTIEQKDYLNDWKSHFKPISISDKLNIYPVWYDGIKKDPYILINPGMAFGTGSHETTSMCLELMMEGMNDGNILDIGTGSGILSIAYNKIYNKTCLAFEIDLAAKKSAEENINLNKCDGIEVIHGDFRDFNIGKYDNLVSNIFAEVLISMMADFVKHLNIGANVIFSGIIKEKEDDVLESMKNYNIEITSVLEKNDWVAIKGVYLG